jgi:CDP-2,3-bis-(O-geranylgeranyl)-sn-glycerol synthase
MPYFLQALWFLLPAGVANMAPVLVKKINFLNYPVDGGKYFLGERLFGDSKTWRGLFFGAVAGVFTIFIQRLFFSQFSLVRSISVIDYLDKDIYMIGFLLGLGALFGDLIKSFFKRRAGVAPGHPWVPFDQIDWIIGALLAVSWLIDLSWQFWLFSLFIFGLLHPAVNIIGYWLKLKSNRF